MRGTTRWERDTIRVWYIGGVIMRNIDKEFVTRFETWKRGELNKNVKLDHEA